MDDDDVPPHAAVHVRIVALGSFMERRIERLPDDGTQDESPMELMSPVAAPSPSPSLATRPSATFPAVPHATAQAALPVTVSAVLPGPPLAALPAPALAAFPASAPATLPASSLAALPAPAPAAIPEPALAFLPALAPVALPAPSPVALPAPAPLSLPAPALAAPPATGATALPATAPAALLATAPATVPTSAPRFNAAEGGHGAASSCDGNDLEPSTELGPPVGRHLHETAPDSGATGRAGGGQDVPASGTSVPAAASPSDWDRDDSMSTDDAQPSSSTGAPDVPVPRRDPSVLLDCRELTGLCKELLDACPVTPGFFAPHAHYICREVGYACFTRRGLVGFAVDAFRFREGDPESPPSLLLFRKMIPHKAGVYWDKCWDKNAKEKYATCAEHCPDPLKQSGSTHDLVD